VAASSEMAKLLRGVQSMGAMKMTSVKPDWSNWLFCGACWAYVPWVHDCKGSQSSKGARLEVRKVHA
jgi:hypothetical protein